MKLLDALLDLLYPPRCTFCHRMLRNGHAPVCEMCLLALPYTGPLARREKIAHLDACYAPLFYEKDVRESLLRFKFDGLTGYAGVYAGFMLKCIDENGISCDSIAWVPVSRKKLRSRGYDQAQLLAQELAVRMGLPCRKMLVKNRENRQQSLLANAAERRANVKGVYDCPSPEIVQGKHILLVDDIVTSGATLSECARILRQNGALSVTAIAVACAKDGK